MRLLQTNPKTESKPVAKRHQMVSASLALLYCFFLLFFSYFNGSRAGHLSQLGGPRSHLGRPQSLVGGE